MQTHDYTHRYWGHDYTITSVVEGEIEICGWGHGLAEGDYVIFNYKGADIRYKIDKIKYFSDPRDMWGATMSSAPYTKDEKNG